MHSGTLSEVSAYLQPDRLDSNKKENGFLDQNPLLLLARTCQNIGVDSKSTPSSSAGSFSYCADGTTPIKPSNPFSVSDFNVKRLPSRSTGKASLASIPPAPNFPLTNRVVSYSPKDMHSFLPHPTPLSSAAASSHNSEESELNIPPSSNSLVQLARLSSILQIPSSTANEAQKRSSKLIDTPNFVLGLTRPNGVDTRPAKRARRQSFGRTVSTSLSNISKPLDFSAHFSAHSSPLSISSSVSPSSLRSTPPAHTTPPLVSQQPIPPTTTSLDLMKNLASLPLPPDSSTLTTFSRPSPDAFFNVGSLLGASAETLRQLLLSFVHSSSELRAAEPSLLENHHHHHNNHNHHHHHPQQQPSKEPNDADSDPSTQCLYCGHMCSDIASLVRHIYVHLASLHKQHAKIPSLSQTPVPLPPPPPPPPPPMPTVNTSNFDLATFYTKLLQNTSVSHPTASSPTDSNSLFLAWLNVFRPVYAEVLAGEANH